MSHDVKVDFVVAGAQKSGTQALGHFLKAHPGIGLADRVESHYFDRAIRRDDSGDYAGYHAMFSQDALEKCTGDITPVYLFQAECPALMHAYNPDFKIIVILRHPGERAYSQWAMEVERGDLANGFLREILMEPLHFLRHGQHPVHSLVARGFYSRQLERLFATFPREQVLVLRNDDLSADHGGTMRRIYRFLGVEEIAPPEPERIHSRQYRPMPRLARWLLRLVYAGELRRLETLLGWDLRAWRR